jgi:enoyl-[acyl-carrier protein] reductase II
MPAMTTAGLTFDNRVTRLLGVELPVVQAPMGWIARSQLASAVSAAGALGIVETSSGELDAFAREVAAMRELTSKPFGVNIAQNLVRDDSVIDTVVEAGVRFVTTSAGDPNRFTTQLKAAGLTVFHVVPTLRGAQKAVDAGVDGLVVEGIEGGGFKTAEGASTMVLLPLIRSKVDVPLIAAGGIVDGATMAAAFVLGAEGVQLGTRFVASVESPVHENWKQAIVASAETGTVLLNRFAKPGMRALRTERTSRLEQEPGNVWGQFGSPSDLYFGGDMEAAIPMSGQVAGRIERVEPVADILAELVEGFAAALGGAADQYLRS